MKQSLWSSPVDSCVLHRSNASTGHCAVCGRPVCGECSVKHGGELYCRGTDHQTIAESWVEIDKSGSEFESDMISKNLSLQGIESRVFSSAGYTYTIGENAQVIVRTYVRKDDAQRSRDVLRALDLGNERSSETSSSR